MDSCVCAALAARDYDAAAVHVSYGQRTEERERQSFLAICDRLGIRDRLMVRNEALCAIGGSALTDRSIAVPESQLARTTIFRSPTFRFAMPIFCPWQSVGRRCWARRRFILARLSRIVPDIPIVVRRITSFNEVMKRGRKMADRNRYAAYSDAQRRRLCGWALNWARPSI